MVEEITTLPRRRQRIQLPGFLKDGGKIAERILAFNWETTSLGSIDSWPQSLKSAVNIALQTPVPVVLLWNEDGVMIYNDAYSIFAGQRHPFLLGSKVVDGWPEIADFNRNVLGKGLKGQKLSYKDQQLVLYRNNKPETVWMDLNYSPVMDEGGKPVGVMAIVVETTDRVLAEQKQKQAEVALRSEKTRLRNLIMHAPAVIAVMRGPEHVYEFANPSYRQVVGHRPLLGKTIREALPELTGQGIYEMCDQAYQTGKPSYGNEVDVLLDMGGKGKVSQYYFNFVYQPYFDDKDRVEGILVHAVDVTEQVVARKQVEEQNVVLKMIASGASLEATLEYLMRSIEKQSPNKMKGSILLLDSDNKHLHHGAAPSLPKKYNEAIDGLEVGPSVGSCGTAVYRKEPVIVSDIASNPLWKDFKDLAERHNLRSCWSTPIMSAKHQVLGTFAMYYEEPHLPSNEDRHIIEFVTRTAALIIERKKAEKALTDSEERFRFMAETLPLKIFTTNAEGKITYFNPQWTEYTGVPMDKLLKDRVLTFIHPEDLDTSMESWGQALKDGKALQNEQRLRRHDGQYRRHISSARAMRNEAGEIVSWFGSMTDIEDVLQTAIQKEKLEILAEGLREQRRQLLAINNAKDEFISLSSHQLRTPATAVKQYISLLMNEYFGAVTPEQNLALQTAYDSNERQLKIINDLLRTAQLDSSNYALVKKRQPIADILRESAQELQTALELKNQRMIFKDNGLKTALLVDQNEVKLAFVNLLENAIKYSYPGGTIQIDLQKKNDKLEVHISDEGVGIAKEDAHRIFEKFTRIDNELSDTVNGTGLGLYWVRRIIKLHKGTIAVQSELGKGSTFIVKLPV
jgi:PAS domain S-box-containing protein